MLTKFILVEIALNKQPFEENQGIDWKCSRASQLAKKLCLSKHMCSHGLYAQVAQKMIPTVKQIEDMLVEGLSRHLRRCHRSSVIGLVTW